MTDLNLKLRNVRKALQLAGDLPDSERIFNDLQDLAQAMDRDGVNRDEPVREIPARLGDRWSTLLMLLLRTGAFRHSTLRRLVAALSAEGKISQRMLTLRLRTLERDGLISRHATNTHPPGMEYAITPLGMGLMQQLDNLMMWIREHKTEITAARERFSQQPGNHDVANHHDEDY
ncbi:MAG: helix-turn-helix domain-containing protein [Steroidobacteraceae bacterium]